MAAPSITAGTPTSGLLVASIDAAFPAGTNRLYILVIFNRNDADQVTSVTGGGLTWSQISGASRTSTQNQSRIDVYAAFGTAAAFTATATLQTTGQTTVAIPLWSDGPGSVSDIEVAVSNDTGATDTNNPNVNITTLSADSRILAILHTRNRTITSADPDYTSLTFGTAGTAGETINAYVYHRALAVAGADTLSFTHNSTTDWIISAIAIKSGGAGAQSVVANLLSQSVQTPSPTVIGPLSIGMPLLSNSRQIFSPTVTGGLQLGVLAGSQFEVSSDLEKPHKPIWFNDGFWWGILSDDVAQNKLLFKRTAQGSWSHIGTDDFGSITNKVDVHYDGTHVWVARISSATLQVSRLDYSAGAWSIGLHNSSVDLWNQDVEGERDTSIVADTNGRVWLFAASNGLLEYVVLNASDLTQAQPRTTLSSLLATTVNSLAVAIPFNDGVASIGVAFGHRDDGDNIFWHHHDSDAITTWQAQEVFDNRLNYEDDHNDLATSPDGSVYAAYKTELAGNGDDNILLVRRSPAGVWGTPVVVWTAWTSTSPGEFSRPRLACDVSGNVYLVAVEYRGSFDGDIYLRIFSNDLSTDSGDILLFDGLFEDVVFPKQLATDSSELLVLADLGSDGSLYENTIAIAAATGQSISGQLITQTAAIPSPVATAVSRVIANLLSQTRSVPNALISPTNAIIAQLVANSRNLPDASVSTGGANVLTPRIDLVELVLQPAIQPPNLVIMQRIAMFASLYDSGDLYDSEDLYDGVGYNVLDPSISATVKFLQLSNNPLIFNSVITQSLTTVVGLLNQINSIYNPVITPGAVSVIAQLLGSGSSLFNVTVSLGGVSVVVPIRTNNPVLPNPVIHPGAVTVITSLLSNTNLLYTPKISSKIIAQLITQAKSIYSPSLSHTVKIALLQDLISLFNSDMTSGVTILPQRVDQLGEPREPSVKPGAVQVVANFLTNLPASYQPSVSIGGITVTPELIQDLALVHTPDILPGGVMVAMELLSSGHSLHNPNVDISAAPGQTIEMQQVLQAALALSPAISAGSVSILANLLADTPSVYPVGITQEQFIQALLLSQAPELFEADLEKSSVIFMDALEAPPVAMIPLIEVGGVTIFVELIDQELQVLGPRIFVGIIPTNYQWDMQRGFTRTRSGGFNSTQINDKRSKRGGFPAVQKDLKSLD